MFNKRIALIIIAFLVSGFVLVKDWNVQKGSALPASQGVIRPYEYRQDLGGKWDGFSGLRAAWTSIRQEKDNVGFLAGLDRQGPFFLPSSEPFEVAARTFRVPAEWSSRDMILTLRGVNGKATIYLNGITTSQQVTAFDGNGGDYSISIPPTAFQYGQDNILLIEMSPGTFQRNSLFGFSWPTSGRITGSITLDAVIDNMVDPEMQVEWDKENAKIIVKTTLSHPQFMEGTSWTLDGVLSDGSAEVAKTSIQLESSGNSGQNVELEFRVKDPKLWSTEVPFLYHLFLKVTDDRGNSDRLSTTLGLRKLMFNEGISLNNKAMVIHGVFLSADSEGIIRSSGKIDEWIKEMQGKGYNLIYFSGFPDELWLEIADRLGMGIWTEWPVNFVPNQNLPDPNNFRNLVKIVSRHPSAWGWTLGTGLDPISSQALGSYWTKSVAMTGGVPGFVLEPPVWNLLNLEATNLGQSIPSEQIIPPERVISVHDNEIQTEWGEIKPLDEEHSLIPASESWKKAQSVLPKALAFWSLLVLIFNIQSVNWRYKELQSQKPKRPLRKSWLWHGAHFLTRETAWAAILTTVLFQINPTEWSFFANIWPILDQIMLQSPWLIWLNLSLLFMMLRIMQIGVAAPFLPGSPHTLGLVYWMERRFRWFVLVIILWALSPVFDIPLYTVPIAYVGFNLLFLPIRIRDVHRAGGSYRGFLVVPALAILIPLGWGIWRWPDLIYLWHWIYSLSLQWINLHFY